MTGGGVEIDDVIGWGGDGRCFEGGVAIDRVREE